MRAGSAAACRRRAGLQHFAHGFLLGGGLQADVDEAGTGDLDGVHPALEGRGLEQHGAQAFGHLARVELERLGQLHGDGAGEVAVGRHFGGFKRGFVARAGGKFFQFNV
jgi:hypothetical protein